MAWNQSPDWVQGEFWRSLPALRVGKEKGPLCLGEWAMSPRPVTADKSPAGLSDRYNRASKNSELFSGCNILHTMGVETKWLSTQSR